MLFHFFFVINFIFCPFIQFILFFFIYNICIFIFLKIISCLALSTSGICICVQKWIIQISFWILNSIFLFFSFSVKKFTTHRVFFCQKNMLFLYYHILQFFTFRFSFMVACFWSIDFIISFYNVPHMFISVNSCHSFLLCMCCIWSLLEDDMLTVWRHDYFFCTRDIIVAFWLLHTELIL